MASKAGRPLGPLFLKMGDAVAGDAAVGEFPRLLLAASAIAPRLAIGGRLHGLLSVACLAHFECLPLGRVSAFLHLHLRGALDLRTNSHAQRIPARRFYSRSPAASRSFVPSRLCVNSGKWDGEPAAGSSQSLKAMEKAFDRVWHLVDRPGCAVTVVVVGTVSVTVLLSVARGDDHGDNDAQPQAPLPTQ